MPESLAILDTDVAILLLDTRKKLDEETYNRRDRVFAYIADVQSKGARFLITTPTVVELAAWPDGSVRAISKMRQFVSGLRVCGLTIGGAQTSGDILLTKLKPRPPGKSRDAIKFDALIAGIAHSREARWLITGNAKDYKPLLATIKSRVEVVDIDAAPAKGQLTLADQTVTR